VGVTVLSLCVCLSVYLSAAAYCGTTGYEAAYGRYKWLESLKIIGDFPETTAFKKYGAKIRETSEYALSLATQPGLARSVCRGAMHLLGYYETAVQCYPLMQLACARAKNLLQV
jgi:hypothetical protein